MPYLSPCKSQPAKPKSTVPFFLTNWQLYFEIFCCFRIILVCSTTSLVVACPACSHAISTSLSLLPRYFCISSPNRTSAYPPTSLPLRSFLPCYFCISSPTVPQRTLGEPGDVEIETEGSEVGGYYRKGARSESTLTDGGAGDAEPYWDDPWVCYLY